MASVLFVHQNFPAQFGGLAAELARTDGIRVAAIGAWGAGHVPGVDLRRYDLGDRDLTGTHAFARRFDVECRRAEQVFYAAQELKAGGFVPDVVVAHPGWGETLSLRSAFPAARIVIYCEYYYQPKGGDVGFDPAEAPLTRDGEIALRARNAATLLALAECDVGVSPTAWQRSTFPPAFSDKIAVCHEGVDTHVVKPDPEARFTPRSGLALRPGAEVVTFVARDLEPIRGYLSFMSALPAIQAARPDAEIVIVGRDGTSYGAHPPEGRTWKEIGLERVRDRLDLGRVHFCGQLPYADYLSVLQVSAAHVYLTAPFVLSWSMTEAMAAGAPLVASDTPPCREFVDESNGHLVDFFDPRAIAGAVIDTLADPDRARRRAAEARASVKARLSRTESLHRMKEILGIAAVPKPSRQSRLA